MKAKWIYRALVTLSHRVTGALSRAGETVDLSHCTPDEIQLLIERGAVERLPAPEPPGDNDGPPA